jgi:hypothetical protein
MQQASSAGAQSGGSAQIRYGVYNNPGNHVGKSVSDLRGQFGSMWGIPGDANAYKGKEKLDDNYVIQPGDNIEFHRRAGEKG